MKQGDLFSSVCEMSSSTSTSDASLTVITSLDEHGQTRIDAVTCDECGTTQPVDNFEISATGSIRRTCKSCRGGQAKVTNKLRKEVKYPDETYACPTCDRTMEDLQKRGQPMLNRWVLDHCHETKTFRGWLCNSCNSAQGRYKDDPDRLLKAYHYLMEHRRKHGL